MDLKIETGCTHNSGKLINIAAYRGHVLPAVRERGKKINKKIYK